MRILVEDYLKIIKDVVSPLMSHHRVQVLVLRVSTIIYVNVMKYSKEVRMCFGRGISMKVVVVS